MGQKLIIPPQEIDDSKLSDHKRWIEETIRFIIEKTDEHTNCYVSEIRYYNPKSLSGEKVPVELDVQMKVK